MKANILKRWGMLSPGKLTACSGAVLLVLAGCGGGHGSSATETEMDKSAEQQEVAAAQAHDPSVDVTYDNWLDDTSLPTPPSAEPQVSLKAPAPNTATEAEAPAASGTASAKIVGPLASKLKDIRQNTHTNLKMQLQKSLSPSKFSEAGGLAEQIETTEPDFEQLHSQVEEFIQGNKNDPEAIVSALKYLNSQLMILSQCLPKRFILPIRIIQRLTTRIK